MSTLKVIVYILTFLPLTHNQGISITYEEKRLLQCKKAKQKIHL